MLLIGFLVITLNQSFSIDNYNVNIKAIKDVVSYSVKLKILLPEFESI